MNTKALEYFLVAASEMNMTRAAERLFISQQALSEQIRRLESELKTELFFRGRKLVLTHSGKYLVEAATQILALERQVKNRFGDIEGAMSGEFVFGLSYTRGRLILPRILPILERLYPNLTVKVEIEPVHVMEKLLLNGSVDIALGFEDLFKSPNIDKTLISNETMYLIVHHRLLMRLFGNKANDVAKELYKQADLRLFNNQKFLLWRQYNFLRKISDDLLKESAIIYETRITESNADILMLLAQQDLGISFLPHMLLVMQGDCFRYNGDDTLHAFPFNKQSGDIRVVVAHLNDRYTAHFSSILADIIKSEYRKSTELFQAQKRLY